MIIDYQICGFYAQTVIVSKILFVEARLPQMAEGPVEARNDDSSKLSLGAINNKRSSPSGQRQ